MIRSLAAAASLLLSCEETALMQQWLSEGHVGMWVPQSRVEHMITPDRLELDYIRRFFFEPGREQAAAGQGGLGAGAVLSQAVGTPAGR